MGEHLLFVTSQLTEERLSKQSTQLEKNALYKTVISINPNKHFQKMVGFGGAFTESSAYTLAQVSNDLRQEVIEAYFDPEKGLNYSIGRVAIHSCDFALENYTYIEEHDVELKTFSINREFKWVIPLIKEAIKTRKSPIQLLASPWSPPAWMKSNHDMNHGGTLLPEYYQAWASYYAKFIHAYREAGLAVDYLTVQNEPAAVQVWDSCIYTPEQERDFIKNYLGPTLVKEGLGDVKLLVWDHNRDIIIERVTPIYEDKVASQYVWGTGFHWYVSEAFENIGKVHELFPDKHLLFTEGCQEAGVHLGSWLTGERYGRNMIGDINNYCEGYLDWNICLNEIGGPNHVGNLCDAPIIVDTKSNEIHYNSSYYYIGHFSKFVLPNAYRIECKVNDTRLQTTAFMNPNQELVVIIMNETDDLIPYSLDVAGQYFNHVLQPHSIHTLIKCGEKRE